MATTLPTPVPVPAPIIARRTERSHTLSIEDMYSDLSDEDMSENPGLEDSDPSYSETSPFALQLDEVDNETNNEPPPAIMETAPDFTDPAQLAALISPISLDEEETSNEPNFFDELGVSRLLQNGFLARKGHPIKDPRPFQKTGLTAMSQGQDIIVEFPATCGKTTMALIGLINKLNFSDDFPEALILTSSTHISKKIKKDILTISSFMETDRPICMALNNHNKIRRAKILANVLVGTPVEFMNLLKSPVTGFSKKFSGEHIKTVVFDRLDEMMASAREMGQIYYSFDSGTQVVVLGRALNAEAMQFAKDHTQHAVIINEASEPRAEGQDQAQCVQLPDYRTPSSSQTSGPFESLIGLPDYMTPPTSQADLESLPESESQRSQNQVVPRSTQSMTSSAASSDYCIIVGDNDVDAEKIRHLRELQPLILFAPLAYIFCGENVKWLQDKILNEEKIAPQCSIFNPRIPVTKSPNHSQVVVIDARISATELSTLPKASLIINFDAPENRDVLETRRTLLDADNGEDHPEMVTFATSEEILSLGDVTTV